MLVIYTDGSCFPNPGKMGIGLVIKRNGETIKEISDSVGRGTNNIAEYKAVIRAMKEAKKLKAKEIVINSDSQLVVNQLNGKFRVKHEGLKPAYKEAKKLMGGMKVKLRLIPREKNKIANWLSYKAIQ